MSLFDFLLGCWGMGTSPGIWRLNFAPISALVVFQDRSIEFGRLDHKIASECVSFCSWRSEGWIDKLVQWYWSRHRDEASIVCV